MSDVDPKPAGPDNKLQLVRKAVEVLNVLAAEGELTAAELAEKMGEPRSSMYRLLSGLHELEMVETGSRKGTSRLGINLLRLGSTVAQRFDERSYALPVMEELHDVTGETVFLCLRRDWIAVCIERLDGRRVQSLALKLGGSLPLHLGAASRALLAFEPREFWTEYLESAADLRSMTPDGEPVTAEILFPVLEEVRRNGIAVSDGDVTPGIAALGVPIFDYRGRVRAALSISGVRPSILGTGAEDLEDRLRQAALTVSHAFGYQRTDYSGVDLG